MKGESENSEENKNHPHFLYSEKEITAFTFHLFLSPQHSYVKYIDIYYYFIIIIIILQKDSQAWLVSSLLSYEYPSMLINIDSVFDVRLF